MDTLAQTPSKMRYLIARLFGRRLQPVLIACFSLVAFLTVGLNTIVTMRVISQYLDGAMDRRVARDMNLADAFYQLMLAEMTSLSQQIAQDRPLSDSLAAAAQGDVEAVQSIDQAITHKLETPALDGTRFIAVLDGEGQVVAGRSHHSGNNISSVLATGDWSELPIVNSVLSTGIGQAATEIIPESYLEPLSLGPQAHIPLIDTPKAASQPYDSREGSAGLTLSAVQPVRDQSGRIIGVVLAAYLFNNDFTLVDRIKEVAGVDTVTIFFGDLRVSTNVMTEAGQRAVGTLVSQEVFDVVLNQGRNYKGRAFVVNDWYITRYDPLYDHQGQVVGSLYVGALESTFQALVQSFSQQVVLIALLSIFLAGIVAIPIARLITRPITGLVGAHRQLAAGDMSVRVEPYGSGELAELGRSFNKMADTIVSTQQELLHKERLASMGQLAAGVAHEINNPLGTILLFSEAMLQETPEGEPQRKDLAMIVNEALRCKSIVADLLNFARQQEVLAQNTDVHALFDEIVEMVSKRPLYQNIHFERLYDRDLPIIQADPAQLQQVFLNLFNNAAEAIENHGTITLITRSPNNRQVEIVISDTGCGIADENLAKIFTPFFTTKVIGKGTGLGLAIVYGIIKMHQGQISVQSQLGRGTTFTITLPVELFNRHLSNLVGNPANSVA